jgi:hypothetical protein
VIIHANIVSLKVPSLNSPTNAVPSGDICSNRPGWDVDAWYRTDPFWISFVDVAAETSIANDVKTSSGLGVTVGVSSKIIGECALGIGELN